MRRYCVTFQKATNGGDISWLLEKGHMYMHTERKRHKGAQLGTDLRIEFLDGVLEVYAPIERVEEKGMSVPKYGENSKGNREDPCE